MKPKRNKDEFDLWLEFEHWESQEGDNPEDDFFNAQITLPNGRVYALNVWTYKALESILQECQETGECLQGAYLLPPDLFVQRLDRTLIEKIVADLIAHGGLKPEWEVVKNGDL